MERGDTNASAIAELAWAADHRVAWDSTKFLGVDSGNSGAGGYTYQEAEESTKQGCWTTEFNL